MLVKISTTNSKLGLIPSVNLPPVLTCRCNCPCAKDCYALRGRYRFQNVKNSIEHNYRVYLENPEQYFADVKKSINNGITSYSYFRWHATGDIVDKRYFDGMIRIAKELPGTQFLAFTKKFELVNKYIEAGGIIPDNLHIVFSAWGSHLRLDNPHRFPEAHVRFHRNEEDKYIPDNAIECSGDCTHCLQCWHIDRGKSVVFNKH